MDFEELMYSPIMSRDIGRSFMMPYAGMGMGPMITPYYGLQPLQAQPSKDAFVSPNQGKKSDKIAKTVGKIVIGTIAVLGGAWLLTKGKYALKTPKASALFSKAKTFFKNAYAKVSSSVKTGCGKVGKFFKNLFKKAPTP